MTFSYTEILKAASPLRGGYPAGAFGMGTFGTDDAAGGSGLISTTLASCMVFNIHTYGNIGQKSAAYALIVSSIVSIQTGGACSGSWIAFGW